MAKDPKLEQDMVDNLTLTQRSHLDKLTFDTGLHQLQNTDEFVCFPQSLPTPLLLATVDMCDQLTAESDATERRMLGNHQDKRNIWAVIARLEISSRQNEPTLEPNLGDQFNVIMNDLFMLVMEPNRYDRFQRYQADNQSLTPDSLNATQLGRLKSAQAAARRASRFL